MTLVFLFKLFLRERRKAAFCISRPLAYTLLNRAKLGQEFKFRPAKSCTALQTVHHRFIIYV